MRRVVGWLVPALALALAACERSGNSSPPTPQPVTMEVPTAEIERLRSLPYAGFVEGDDDVERSGIVTFDRERCYTGYTLYSIFQLAAAYLVDEDGKPVRSWSDPNGYHWGNCELTADGDLLVTGSTRISPTQRRISDREWYAMRLNWRGETVWKKPWPAHHDMNETPKDRLALLTWSYRRVAGVHAEALLRDEEITIASLDGDLLEQHSLYDMLSASPVLFRLQPVQSGTWRGVFEVELFHANSVELMRYPALEARSPIYAASNAIVTMRHQDAVVIVDLETDSVVWSWGQGEVLGPHNATVLENGNILLYDNGLGRGWSRVIELNPLTKTIVWEYKAPNPADFYSKSRGANQRMPNGNTLITDSDHGRVFEVTPDGEIVWEFLAPHFKDDGPRATIVRAHRYDPAYIQAIGRRFGDVERFAAPQARQSSP